MCNEYKLMPIFAVMDKTIAVVFLCHDNYTHTAKFVDECAKRMPQHTFYMINDSDFSMPTSENQNMFSVNVSDRYCATIGFVGCNLSGNETHIKKPVIAWDRMFAYFSAAYNGVKIDSFLPLTHDFYLVIEQDCFVPSAEAIENLINRYSGCDLLVPWMKERIGYMGWHWRLIDEIKGRQHDKSTDYYSFVACCGMSSAVMQKIIGKSVFHSLWHHEAMIPTVAMSMGAKIIIAKELRGCMAAAEWSPYIYANFPKNIFHPDKQIYAHESTRSAIKAHNMNAFLDKTEIPEFLYQ